MKNKLILAGLAALSLASCKPNFTADSPQSNGLDFSNYVAIGNSLTAGYADGSLYRSGQQNSYPAILSNQFKIVGGGDFKIPLLPGNAGWPAPKRILGLATDCKGVTSLSPLYYSSTLDTAGSAANVYLAGPYNNMGIPGIRAVDYLTAGYALFNPYAGRLFSSPFTKAIDEVRKNPATFFTMWLGSNDVLGYATSGGEGNAVPSHPDNISDVNTFKDAIDSTLNMMTSNGAKGVIINIPDVTSIPFFTTIPANGLALSANDAAALNAAYSGVPGFTATSFSAGANYFVIQDPDVTVGFRQAKAGELMLLTLPLDSVRCAGWGSLKPIPKKYVLSANEISAIRTATTAFNNHIRTRANEKNIAFLDIDAYLKTLTSGLVYNGVTYSPAFVTGGAFSLDGVHLTPRGYALVANRILLTINNYYKSTIPMVDVNQFDGIRFP